MNHFLDETEYHRKYNIDEHQHPDDVNQGFPLLEPHHVLSRDNNNNNKTNQPASTTSLTSSAVKEQASKEITATMPNLSNMPLKEPIEMKTDSHNDINRIHGMTNNNNTNNNALSENGDRRLRMLEKNRRAAARCRQRKKVWVEELTQQHQEAKRRSDELQGIILNLREEVYFLKSQILAHEGCDCHAVKDYIKIFLMNEVVQKSKFNAPSSQQGATDSVAKITTVISSVERNNSPNI